MEAAFSLAASRVFNLVAAFAVGSYALWRFARNRGIARAWGFRVDNFWSALRRQLMFGIPAAVALYGVGLWQHSPPLPLTFWAAAVLYPVWGTAQQFVLQNLLARNLRGVIPFDLPRAFVAALLFSLSHYPRLALVALAFVAGFFLTALYQRQPNLWIAGWVHGVLGALTFYYVFQEDPGGRILKALQALAE